MIPIQGGVKLTETITLDNLSDVAISNPVTGQVPTYNGSSWANATPVSGITWSEITDTSVNLAADTGYVINNAALVTGTLPSTCAVGKIIAFVGKGAGLWKIAQNASQYIKFGSLVSTTGTGGYVLATGQYDCLELICTTADVGFTVRSSIGVLDVV